MTLRETSTVSPVRGFRPVRASRLDREGAEAAQLHPVAPGQGRGDLLEDGGDDPLDIPVVEMRIELADPKDEFGLGHSISPKGRGSGTGGLLFVSLPKRSPGVKDKCFR
jgi:hypothetical protein